MEEKSYRPRMNTEDSLLHLHGTNIKLLIVMAGLPGRGKTYISKRVCRRKLCGSDRDHSFFDPDNEEKAKEREMSAHMAFQDVTKWFIEEGEVALLDGTNSTVERRVTILKWVDDFSKRQNIKVRLLWVESVCNNQEMIERNVLSKLTSPDYVGMNAEEALSDFKMRIQQYEKHYVPLGDGPGERELSYIQMINAGTKIITNKIKGYLPSRIALFLYNIRISQHTIYFTRHGESQFNVADRIGGDSSLSPQGQKYAKKFAEFMEDEIEAGKLTDRVSLWTSTMQRTQETAAPFYAGNKHRLDVTKHIELQEISVGICDGLSYHQVEEDYPDEFAARAKDKLRYRYPQGESYMDVIARLEPIIFELERTSRSVVVVCHRAVLRCLLSYFMDFPMHEIPFLEIPLHQVLKLTPSGDGNKLDKIPLNV